MGIASGHQEYLSMIVNKQLKPAVGGGGQASLRVCVKVSVGTGICRMGGAVMAPDLFGLTGVACMGPVSDVPAQVVPDKPVTHEMLGGMDAGVGESMQEVKNLASSVKWSDRPGGPIGNIAKQNEHVRRDGRITEKSSDGSTGSFDGGALCLKAGKVKEVYDKGDRSNRGS